MTRQASIFQRLLLTGLVSIGVGVAWGVAVYWSTQMTMQFWGDSHPSEELVIRLDGTPLIAATIAGYRSQSLRTLDGVEIPDDHRVPMLYGAGLPAEARPGGFRELDWASRLTGFADDRRPARYWYFVHDGRRDGRGYFACYDSVSKLCVGYVGLQGFRTDIPPSAECIPVDGDLLRSYQVFNSVGYVEAGQEPQYGQALRRLQMISGNRLLEIDTRKHTVRTLLEADQLLSTASHYPEPLPGDWSVAAPDASEGEDGNEIRLRTPMLRAVRTSEQIAVFDVDMAPLRKYPLPPDLRHKYLRFYEVSDGLALLVAYQQYSPHAPREIIWLNTGGQIVRRTHVTLDEPRETPQLQAWLYAVAIPVPVIGGLGLPLIAMESRDDRESEQDATLWDALRRGLPHAKWQLTLVLGVALAGAVVCARRQRRFAQSHTWLWLLFVLLGGFPALLGYLLNQHRPVLAACPSCQRLAPRDRGHCVHCAAIFPPPEKTGIEVLDEPAASPKLA